MRKHPRRTKIFFLVIEGNDVVITRRVIYEYTREKITHIEIAYLFLSVLRAICSRIITTVMTFRSEIKLCTSFQQQKYDATPPGHWKTSRETNYSEERARDFIFLTDPKRIKGRPRRGSGRVRNSPCKQLFKSVT